jgi:hypothetical protein
MHENTGKTQSEPLMHYAVIQPCITGMKAALAAAEAAYDAAGPAVEVKIEEDAPRHDKDKQQLFVGDTVQLLTSNGIVAAQAVVKMIHTNQLLDPVDKQAGKVTTWENGRFSHSYCHWRQRH